MSEFGLTKDGFVLKTFDDIRSSIDQFQWSKIDKELDLSDDSPGGIQNASTSLEVAALWELAQATEASLDPDTAEGWSLDKVANFTGTTRSKYGYTKLTGQVTLSPNYGLEAGAIAHLKYKPNTRFISQETVPSSSEGGTFDVTFKAENQGTIQVSGPSATYPAGELSEISVAVPGWLGVSNSAAATVIGSEPEEDPEFRKKREEELQKEGSSNLPSIVSGVRAVNGVLAVEGSENRKSYPNNNLPGNSFEIIVRGGSDLDIATAIFDKSPAGINSFGLNEFTIEDEDGEEQKIRYTRGLGLPVFIRVEYQAEDEDSDEPWDDGTEDEAKQNIANYGSTLGLAEEVLEDRVRQYAIATPGIYNLGNIKIDTVTPPVGSGDLPVPRGYFADINVNNITMVKLEDV